MAVLQLFAVLVLLFVAQWVVGWTVRHFADHDWKDGLVLMVLGLALSTAAGLLAINA